MASVESYSSGYIPQVITATESAGESYKKGDLIHLDSDGLVEIATAGNIDGIAKADASGTANTLTEIELIDLNQLYTCAYKASATAQTLVGALADFVFTAGAHTLDDSGATTDVFVVALDPRDTLGTSGGRLIFRFLPALVKG